VLAALLAALDVEVCADVQVMTRAGVRNFGFMDLLLVSFPYERDGAKVPGIFLASPGRV